MYVKLSPNLHQTPLFQASLWQQKGVCSKWPIKNAQRLQLGIYLGLIHVVKALGGLLDEISVGSE